MIRDYTLFPDDDNGNVLWQMHEDGDDLSEAHEIEFLIAFDTKEKAEKCALHLLHQEQKISLYEDEEKKPSEWMVVIYVYLEPEYEGITELEKWFMVIAEQFNGEYDGWGCLSYIYEDADNDEF